jgi:tetratricopeptide (TPR) repeat protein
VAEGLLGGLLGGEDEAAEAEAGEGRISAEAFAAALSEEHAKHDPEVARAAAQFLHDQSTLLKAQTAELEEQRALRLRHLQSQSREGKIRRASQRIRVATQVVTAMFGALLLAGVGLLVWQAANDRSLVVEPFGAPPDFATRGLRGEVLAAELLDRLQAMDSATDSIRPPRTYRTSWSEDIKVEVPETKVSLGELRGYLRDWLGHPTHVTGDIWRDGATLYLTVRVGERAISVSGSDSDLRALIDRAAEQVFSQTQPYRYSKWLERHDRPAEGLVVAQALATSPDLNERKWALREVCVLEGGFFRFGRAYDACSESLRIEPGNPQALFDRSITDLALGWTERGMTDLRDSAAAMRRPRPDFMEEGRAAFLPLSEAVVAELRADLAEAERLNHAVLQGSNFQDVHDSARLALPGVLVRRHDLAGARAALAELKLPLNDASRWNASQGVQPEWEVPEAAGDYVTALAALDQYEAAVVKAGDTTLGTRILKAERARLYVLMGRLDLAKAVADQTPADCYPCLRARGKVAAAQGDWAGAERWFAEAAHQGPTLPFAHQEWGEARLAHGDLAGAETAFQEAARRAPNWADPLKGLGDVAARRGQWRDAVDAYDKALTHAPGWGELKQARATAAARLR